MNNDKKLSKDYEEKQKEIERKTESLKNSYNFIIRIDLEKETAECIHKSIQRPIGISYDVVLTLASANDYFLNNYVLPQDREKARSFFEEILALKDMEKPEEIDYVIQAVYDFQFDNGDTRKYVASVVIFNRSNVLLCGRDITDATPPQEHISMSHIVKKLWNYYNTALDKNNMEGFVIEVNDDKIMPVFLCRKALRRMRMTEREYVFISDAGITAGEFISRLGVDKESFDAVLRGENSIFILKDENDVNRKYYVKVISSRDNTSVFTVLYSTERINQIIYDRIIGNDSGANDDDEIHVGRGAFIPGNNSRIWIRTFGSFDVFVNGVPIRFTSAKSKELLAVLVDRRGGSLSAEEAISYLWEDKPADKQVMSNYRKVAMRMHETLDEYDIGDLVINNKGVRSLNMAVADCDLYKFIVKDKTCTDCFHGQYMQNYSWGERTLATLCQIAGEVPE